MDTLFLRYTVLIVYITTVETGGEYQVGKNRSTGRGYGSARADSLVSCDDPMVECDVLHHILSSRHKSSVV